MSIDITMVWAGVIAFVVFMYVLLDGFDLGLGVLFPFMDNEVERDIAMNSVAPIWDFNETWLVLGAAGLFGAFPLAYAALLPAFYLPILVMLIALVFRGVAFEFRFKVHEHKPLWSRAFFFGSLFATFSQGVVLGSFVQGVPVVNNQYAGGAFDWLTPFSLMTGAALVAGYGLLGATWLVAKSTGRLHEWARLTAIKLLAGGGADHGRGQPLGAVPERRDRGAMVLLAQHLLPIARAAARGRRQRRHLLRASARQEPARPAALPDDDGAVPAGLCGPGHQPLAQPDPAGDHHL
jgi:cytochrome d ubiquinol oxidase subunit II